MKRFLRTLLIFLIPLGIGAWCVEYGMTSLLKQSEKGDLAVWNHLYAGKIQAPVLVYGSSRAWVHFDTEIMEENLKCNVYNLGGDGYDLPLQLLRHQLIILKNIKPQFVYVSLDYFMFKKRDRLPNPTQFLPYVFDSLMFTRIEPYREFNWPDYNLPIWRYKGYSNQVAQALHVVVKPETNKPDRYHGFAGQDKVWNDDLTKARLKKSAYIQQIDSNLVNDFENFLYELNKNDIKVVLVYTPEYIEGQNFVQNRSEIMKLFKNIADETNTPYYDFSEDSISMNRKLFYNSQHLNREGATVFTNKLMQLLEADGLFN